MKDVSEWTIWIDDVEGELAMTAHDCGGREIDVVAKEEILPYIQSLIDRIKLAESCMARSWERSIIPNGDEVARPLRDYKIKYPEVIKNEL